jgi:thiol-disulfide isomerase/thioredoxin
MKNVVEVNSEAEYRKALAEAKGPVALEFTMEGCDACDEEKPKVEKLAAKCPTLTVIRADVDKLGKLADDFKCDATPTLYYADSPEGLVPGTAKELEDSSELRKKIKCARTKK